MNFTGAIVGGVAALLVSSATGCASRSGHDAEAGAPPTTASEGRHSLTEAPDAFGVWERATHAEATSLVEDLVADSEAEGDEASGGAYMPRGRVMDGGGPLPEAFVIYVGVELGHDDVSALGPQAFLDDSAEELGVDLRMVPTRSSLGGALGCGSASHQGVPQVACFWAAAGVSGTVIYNLDRPRSLTWAAAQTRELRGLVEHDDAGST